MTTLTGANQAKSDNPFSRAAVTAVVTILLSPISIAVVYYITHLLQAPKFKVEYVKAKPVVTSRPIDPKVVRRVRQNLALASALRGNLANLQQQPGLNCRAWLDDADEWDDDCLPIVLDAVNGMLDVMDADIRALESNITAIKTSPRNRPPALLPTSVHPVQEITQLAMMQDINAVTASFQNDLDVAKYERRDIGVLLRELNKIQKQEQPWTGIIKVYVGVLNYGDMDGVIAAQSKLKEGGEELPYESNAYTVIKSHSFQEIEFSEKPSQSTETLLNHWHSLVLKREGAPFQFVIIADGKELPPKEAASPK